MLLTTMLTSNNCTTCCWPCPPLNCCLSLHQTTKPQQGNESQGKALANPSIQKVCKQECGKCVTQGQDPKTCPKASSPLPKVCAQGLQFNSQVKALVSKCLAIYNKDKKAATRVSGC